VWNVDGMLDGMTPEQFDEWIAFRRIEPDPEERLREIVKLGFSALCAAWGSKLELEMLDPWAKEPEAMGPGQAASVMRQAFGL
jgi:hypothetical protein